MAEYRELNKFLVIAIAAIVFLVGAYFSWLGLAQLSWIHSNDGRYLAYFLPLGLVVIGLPLAVQGARFLLLASMGILRSRDAPTTSFSSVSEAVRSDIPTVYESLRNEGSDGSYAVFIPSTASGQSEKAVNLQFSIENGRIGFDWVLLAPANIADRTHFEKLAQSMRFHVQEFRNNDVSYLRTTDRNSVDLCIRVLTELYSVPSNARLELIVEGFKWPR